jgi:hypothetical protein
MIKLFLCVKGRTSSLGEFGVICFKKIIYMFFFKGWTTVSFGLTSKGMQWRLVETLHA